MKGWPSEIAHSKSRLLAQPRRLSVTRYLHPRGKPRMRSLQARAHPPCFRGCRLPSRGLSLPVPATVGTQQAHAPSAMSSLSTSLECGIQLGVHLIFYASAKKKASPHQRHAV